MRMRSFVAGTLLLVGLLVSAPQSGSAHGLRRNCCPPPPPITVVLQVCHPCTGCQHEVKVCIPACCTDVPCVSQEHTIIGAGRTVYRWQSGHTVVVRYQNDGGYRVLQRG